MALPHAARLLAPLALLALSACRPSRLDVQETYAAFLEPALVQPGSAGASAAPAALRVMRVRAYAGDGYRAHVGDFEARISAQVRSASAIAEADFGVRLELESVRAWGLPEADDHDLAVALERLVRDDPALEVDWVVGFVAPAPARETTHDLIGRAHLFGRHFVVRAMESPRLVEWVEGSFDALPPEERAAMVARRQRHLETTTFLHEWGHTLGAVHECADRWIMAREYSVMVASFSPESARLVRLGLAQRDRAGADARREWSDAYRMETSRMSSAWWDCGTLERDLGRAQRMLYFTSRAFAWEERPAGTTDLDGWLATIVGALGPRLKTVSERVRSVADRPARQERIAVLEVVVGAGGEVKEVRVLVSGGVTLLDEGAVEAVREAQPFPPPPPEFFEAPLRGSLTFGVRAEL